MLFLRDRVSWVSSLLDNLVWVFSDMDQGFGAFSGGFAKQQSGVNPICPQSLEMLNPGCESRESVPF